MNKSIGIIEYGVGNLKSLENTFRHINNQVIRVKEDDDFDKIDYLVLPGVGAFSNCMEKLNSSKLIPQIYNWVNKSKPLLGICVGMQMLFDSSEEFGEKKGLGIIKGKITKLNIIHSELKIPHLGWNKVTFHKKFNLFQEDTSGDFYFAHSYSFKEPENEHIIASCSHSEKFGAVVKKENTVGVQFHPEKSQDLGIKFLKSFLSYNN
ncbi:imidazole glycerol phosphate synthase subunit HisH [Candidatus Pelagibacter sp.]|nr:imidazole glycerol phosphate synthase subunit HisH [Candidatus Pelagibacter sp.]